MMPAMHVLYVGSLSPGGTCLHRLEAMQTLGHWVVPVDMDPPTSELPRERLWHRLSRRLFGLPDTAGVNDRLLAEVTSGNYDVIWIDKGLTIEAGTLLRIKKLCPKTILAHFNPDDPLDWTAIWRRFRRCIPLYDVHFVPRRVNVEEYRRYGARRVAHVVPFWGYCPRIHRPQSAAGVRLGGRVGFIGTYEKARARSLLYLARHGIPVRVWGGGWLGREWLTRPNLQLEGRLLEGGDYAAAICSFEVNLAFLRKMNRDQHTSRSIEIPACGGFMLAERTEEHQQLFEEAKEADYFSSNEELLTKIRYYLDNPAIRRQIAQGGHERCLRSGYSNPDRMRAMLEVLRGLRVCADPS